MKLVTIKVEEDVRDDAKRICIDTKETLYQFFARLVGAEVDRVTAKEKVQKDG